MQTQKLVGFSGREEGDGLVMEAVVVVVAVRIIRDRAVSHCGEKESGGVSNLPPPLK